MGIAKLFAWGYWDTVEQYQFKAARTPKHSRQVEWTVQPNCTACWVCCLYRCILGFALLEASDVCRLAARLDFRQTARLMIKTIRPEVALYSLWSGMGLDAHGKPNGKCRSSGDGWFLLISYRVGVPVGWTCFAEWLQNAVCLTDTKRSALIASLGAFLIQGIMSSASPPSMPSTLWRFLCFQWFSTCVFCGYEGIGLSSVCPLMRMPSFNIRLEWCMQCEVSRYPGRYCLSSLFSWQGCLFVCSSWGV